MKEKIRRFFEKKENLYLTLALTFGLLMAVINPPFAGVSDEHAHYWKSWAVAEGYWKCTGEDKIPQTAEALPDQIKPISYEGIKDKKIVVALLKQKLFEKDTIEKSTIGGAVCTATFFGYLPQAAGLNIGKLLGLSALGDFYLARIFVLLFSILFMYLAIKTVPFGKMIFVSVGLIPMTIRQFSSMGYDGLQIALAALFLAYVLKLAVEKEKSITKKDIAVLLLLSLIGLNVKVGYFVMAFLIFILPMEKFAKRWQWWVFTLGFVALNLAMIFGVRSVFVELAKPEWTDPPAQMAFVINHPLHFVNIAFESYYGSSGFIPYIEGMLFKVGNGGSLDAWLYVFMFVGMLAFLCNQDEKVELSKKQRLIMLAVFLANFFIIYLALYLGWSKPGAKGVSGVQGRYFLVIIPLFIFTFYKSGFSLNSAFIKKYQQELLAFFFVIVFSFVFLAIYQSQYSKKKVPSNPVYEQYLLDIKK
jgi:uncharacterized membrane protein